jgi:integrase
MKSSNRLTALQLPGLLKQPGRHRDGDGLILLVRANGAAFWIMRYMLDGKNRELGLGPLRLVNLAEARARAREARQALLDGQDPVAVKKAEKDARKLSALRKITFAQAAERFMQTDAVQKLGNREHRRQWRTTLDEACKTIGSLPLEQIDSAIMLKTLLPVWQRAPETASRLRARIERVLAWSIAHQLRPGPNPASREVLRDALPSKPKPKHHPAMRYQDLPTFMKELRERNSISARALEFTILCATRTSETLGARWDEVDLGSATWCIPGSRMKAGREHVVPLSHRAVEILRGLANSSAPKNFVFTNGNGERLARDTMNELIKGMGVKATVHGFRSSFRDWCGDRTAWPREVIEHALAHAVGNKTEAAYRRQDALQKRARLMQQWCDFLSAPAAAGANVRALRSA